MIPSLRLLRSCCLMVAAAVSACSSLPTSGPSNKEVVENITGPDNPLGARLVDLTPEIVKTLRDRPDRSLSVIDGLRSNASVDRLGPGDIVSVSIYEAGNGLFNTRRANADGETSSGSTAETLPRLQVDRNGNITVPYAGQIRVSGQTMTDVQRTIERRISDRTAQPQVVVSLVTNGSNIVYISGDVRTPGRYPLTLAHERLLDIVALAGGPTHSPQDTLVKVSRRGREATTSLTRVQTIAEENIPVDPQDRIQVDYLPRSYLSFGATGRIAQIQFDAATVSLAEAVARAGGLDDSRANPEAVFLFRYERPVNAQALGLAPAGLAGSSAPVIPGAMAQGIPVVYRVNMRDPQSYFAIQQFAMNDKDVIYIANAPTVQIYKFLQLIYTFTSPAITARAVTQ
ncbi:MAG: polysaccharide biosynthesis/export family protein [Janthinobacterium lividum]